MATAEDFSFHPDHDNLNGMVTAKNSSSSSSSLFCNTSQMPMAMYMDGFHWSCSGRSFLGNEQVPWPFLRCLQFGFQTWLLDTPGQFQGAMVFSFLLGFLLELLSAIRHVVVVAGCSGKHPGNLYPPPQSPHQQNHYSQRNSHSSSFWLSKHVALTLIYALQSLLGFVLMFTSMTYSYELLLATVVGLMTGNVLLVRYKDFVPSPPRRRNNSNNNQDLLRQPLLLVPPRPFTHRHRHGNTGGAWDVPTARS